VRLTRLVYRAHNPKWFFAPASGQGAALTGGRFNPAGVPALYTSVRFETAWLEAQQAFPFKSQPMTLCGYEVDCEDVLDLTEPATLSAQGIVATDLACPWKDMASRGIKPPSWILAERLAAAGVAAILAPSFAAGASAADVNVVFWDWTPDPPHRARVIDGERRLPLDATSRR
jgi:RES domain-containing protein